MMTTLEDGISLETRRSPFSNTVSFQQKTPLFSPPSTPDFKPK
ncbi:hypothetical protein SLEP1_g42398 [Rubroshorea leprosula]|uniref:Uncharacterized protein n=1 Tax=Rubroshorea leprosula TaxID=152421 RepID=A0AAV5L9S2_9ROSI|nr:hypothetical protein SLEP1_g42398 [Rubroshorea leprosula]